MIGLDTSKLTVIFDAGATHRGCDSACRLVHAAARAGADAIKFQIIDADRMVADRSLQVSYSTQKAGVVQQHLASMHELLRARMLWDEQWVAVHEVAGECRIAMFATVGFADELLWCGPSETVKICSGDIDLLSWIAEAASCGFCVHIDTGSATLAEIERAHDTIVAGGGHPVVHHCPSGYPAKVENVHLRQIETLRKMFPTTPIAYSDHSPGVHLSAAAIALGATTIEKTLTEDRTADGPEHMAAVTIGTEAAEFVEALRETFVALGSTRRTFDAEALAARKMIRRSRRKVDGKIVYSRPQL